MHCQTCCQKCKALKKKRHNFTLGKKKKVKQVKKNRKKPYIQRKNRKKIKNEKVRNEDTIHEVVQSCLEEINLNHSFSPVCKEVEISLLRYNSNRGSSEETSVEESFGTASPKWKHTTDSEKKKITNSVAYDNNHTGQPNVNAAHTYTLN